jgi:hypothetical protein
MRQVLAVLASFLFLAVSCGEGDSDESKPMAGQRCEENALDAIKCGLAIDERPSVLICASISGIYVWAVQEICPGICEDSRCVATPGFDTFPPEDEKTASDVSEEGNGGEDGPGEDIFVNDLGMICEPGSIGCESELAKKICNMMGSAWEAEPCAEGEGCDQGYCLPRICTPWELGQECVGPTAYSRCNNSGTRWEAGYCQAPLTCYQGNCVPWICYPGDVTCKGMTAIQECQLDEAGETDWVVTEECKGGLCKEGKCMSACEVNLKANTYLGCDYWAVDLDNVEAGQYQPVAVVVSVPTEETTNAEITMTDMSQAPPKDLTPGELSVTDMLIAPGQLKTFMLPPGKDLDGSILTNKTIRVVSTAPVTVHQFNPMNGENVYTNDASLLLPSNVGGTEFVVMSWPQRTEGFTFRGFAAVIATQEGTTKVEVYPTTPVLGGPNVMSMQAYPPSPYVFYLQQGDVLNLETDGQQGSDLTGSRIVTDQKVNVMGGHECANIPLGTNYCDHVEQQLFPVASWGNHYIGDAFSPRNANQKDVWRIAAGANNVQVTLNPNIVGPYVLNKAEWVEFASGASFEVVATGPIMLGHYMQGSNYSGFDIEPACINGLTGIGDPAFTLASPIEQYLKEYIVLTPDTYLEDFINITAKMSLAGAITIDGAPLSQGLVPVGASGYGVVQYPVPDGVHTIKAPEPIGVTAYGYDCDVSYAYPGGLALKTLQ